MKDDIPRIHWLIALVPFVVRVQFFTVVLIALRLPAAVILFLSALVAGMVMLVAQPHILTQIGEGNNFRGLMLTYYSSTAIDTGNETLTNLKNKKIRIWKRKRN